MDGGGDIPPFYTFLDGEVTRGKGRVIVRQANGFDRGRQDRGNDAQLDGALMMVSKGEDVTAAILQQTGQGNAPKEDYQKKDTTIS